MKKFIVLSLLLLTVWACSEGEKEAATEEKQEVKMAEFSELALLMKKIHLDAKDWKASLESGEMIEDSIAIYKLLVESTPTKAEVKGPVFEGFAASYQANLDAFLAAEDIDLAKSAYNNLVSTCVTCHQSYCPGPIPTIEKLYLPES